MLRNGIIRLLPVVALWSAASAVFPLSDAAFAQAPPRNGLPQVTVNPICGAALAGEPSLALSRGFAHRSRVAGTAVLPRSDGIHARTRSMCIERRFWLSVCLTLDV